MQQDLTAIYNSGQHLLGLINDILDLAKIEAGKMELAFDEVNITDVVTSVLATMSGLIKDKPIEMKHNIEPNTAHSRADAIRIRQVMINLLSNAAKFTEEGSITVNVIPFIPEDGGKRDQVSVTDTGPGISERIRKSYSCHSRRWTPHPHAKVAAPVWVFPSASN
jgi:signal transduction histidine kinase